MAFPQPRQPSLAQQCIFFLGESGASTALQNERAKLSYDLHTLLHSTLKRSNIPEAEVALGRLCRSQTRSIHRLRMEEAPAKHRPPAGKSSSFLCFPLLLRLIRPPPPPQGHPNTSHAQIRCRSPTLSTMVGKRVE